jgi:hypothetical protein
MILQTEPVAAADKCVRRNTVGAAALIPTSLSTGCSAKSRAKFGLHSFFEDAYVGP